MALRLVAFVLALWLAITTTRAQTTYTISQNYYNGTTCSGTSTGSAAYPQADGDCLAGSFPTTNGTYTSEKVHCTADGDSLTFSYFTNALCTGTAALVTGPSLNRCFALSNATSTQVLCAAVSSGGGGGGGGGDDDSAAADAVRPSYILLLLAFAACASVSRVWHTA